MIRKGIYLGACKAYHAGYDLVYQDIDNSRDLGGDMLEVDLSPYDYVIATPPCNWWSKLNMTYWRSEYALKTRHLLPLILIRLSKSGKPFIVECVKNMKRYRDNHIFDICSLYDIKFQIVGRHIYFTNFDISLDCPQIQDFKSTSKGPIRCNNDGYNQGGTNVHNVIEIFLDYVNRRYVYE